MATVGFKGLMRLYNNSLCIAGLTALHCWSLWRHRVRSAERCHIIDHSLGEQTKKILY